MSTDNQERTMSEQERDTIRDALEQMAKPHLTGKGSEWLVVATPDEIMAKIGMRMEELK